MQKHSKSTAKALTSIENALKKQETDFLFNALTSVSWG